MSIRRHACTGKRHVGPRELARGHFGHDSRKPDGRCAVCFSCRRVIAKRGRDGCDPVEQKSADYRTKRICKEPGCMDPPTGRGTSYCARHRKRPDGRGAIIPARMDSEPRTYHDWAVGLLAGSGRRRTTVDW